MTIAEVRNGLVDSLTAAGLKANAHMPRVFNPPGIITYPANEYLTIVGFHTYEIKFELFLVYKTESIGEMTRKADETIMTVIGALDDWKIEEVSGLESLSLRDNEPATNFSRVICTKQIQV